MIGAVGQVNTKFSHAPLCYTKYGIEYSASPTRGRPSPLLLEKAANLPASSQLNSSPSSDITLVRTRGLELLVYPLLGFYAVARQDM